MTTYSYYNYLQIARSTYTNLSCNKLLNSVELLVSIVSIAEKKWGMGWIQRMIPTYLNGVKIVCSVYINILGNMLDMMLLLHIHYLYTALWWSQECLMMLNRSRRYTIWCRAKSAPKCEHALIDITTDIILHFCNIIMIHFRWLYWRFIELFIPNLYFNVLHRWRGLHFIEPYRWLFLFFFKCYFVNEMKFIIFLQSQSFWMEILYIIVYKVEVCVVFIFRIPLLNLNHGCCNMAKKHCSGALLLSFLVYFRKWMNWVYS